MRICLNVASSVSAKDNIPARRTSLLLARIPRCLDRSSNLPRASRSSWVQENASLTGGCFRSDFGLGLGGVSRLAGGGELTCCRSESVSILLASSARLGRMGAVCPLWACVMPFNTEVLKSGFFIIGNRSVIQIAGTFRIVLNVSGYFSLPHIFERFPRFHFRGGGQGHQYFGS